jgi:hypothetical protein
MGEHHQISMIAPEVGVRITDVGFTGKLSECRVIPDGPTVRRYYSAWAVGTMQMRDIADRLGCNREVLALCFEQEYGRDWRKGKVVWA